MFELQGAKFYSNEKDFDPKDNLSKKQRRVNRLTLLNIHCEWKFFISVFLAVPDQSFACWL